MAHYCELLGPSLHSAHRGGSVARSSGFALCSFDADAILGHDPGSYLSQVSLGIMERARGNRAASLLDHP
jgi:hypothetical protein